MAGNYYNGIIAENPEMESNLLKHAPLTSAIIGSGMKVQNEIGPGYPEWIYQRAFEVELLDKNLKYQKELPVSIYYKGFVVGESRIDFLVEEKIIVELKVCDKIETGHIKQVLNYLHAFNLDTGLLINFGPSTLNFKRVSI